MFGGFTVLEIGVIFAAILVSLAAHEAMHGFMAYWLGDDTAKEEGRLTLNPFRHIDTFMTVLLPLGLILLGLPPFFVAKPVPFNPHRVRYEEFGAAFVALAGPLTNILLASGAAFAIRIIGVATGTEAYALLTLFIQVNIGFFVFNMIPFPPLDGSRLLYALAPDPVRRVMERIEAMGLAAIFIFMFLLFPVLGPAVSQTAQSIYTFLLR